MRFLAGLVSGFILSGSTLFAGQIFDGWDHSRGGPQGGFTTQQQVDQSLMNQRIMSGQDPVDGRSYRQRNPC